MLGYNGDPVFSSYPEGKGVQTPVLQPIIPVTGWNKGTSRYSDSEGGRFSRGLHRNSAGEGEYGEQTEEQEERFLVKPAKGGGLTDIRSTG